MAPLAPYQWGALASTAAAVVAVVLLSWGRAPSADHTVVSVAWLAGLVAVLVAAGAIGSAARLRWWRPGRQWLVATAVVAVAFVLRMTQLDRFPRVVDSDGMGFAVFARDIAAGRVRDPFSTGYLSHPMAWSYGQRAVMAFTGETLAGARTLSALVGTAAVAATIAWGRRIAGWGVGLAAGALLAASPMHLHFSRLAINNVTDTLALPLVLVLLDRGVVDRSRVAAVGAGIAIGAAQYGYLGSRVVIPIAVLVSAVLLARARRRGELRAAGHLLGWTVIGAVVAIAPLVVHYVEAPEELSARDAQVSIFAGWLDDETDRTGDSTVHVLADQATRALLLPALAGREGYHPPAPLVGWPLLVGAAVGVGVVIAGWRRNRHCAALAVAWVIPLAAIATTIGHASHRWVIGTPVVAVSAAIGLVALGRAIAATRIRSWSARTLSMAGVAVVLGVGAFHVAGFFREENALRGHGDPNSLVATELARELRAESPGTVVHVAFSPRMFFRSHAVVPFLAPHVDGRDLVEPVTTVGQVPDAPMDAVFVFLPERLDELAVVKLRHPGGEERTVVALGHHLYTTYRPGGATP